MPLRSKGSDGEGSLAESKLASQGQSNSPSSFMRYMGTKRAIVSEVGRTINEISPAGPVADLFCGVGAVTSALAPAHPVVANDIMRFIAVSARARFTEQAKLPASEVARAMSGAYIAGMKALRDRFGARAATEARAVAAGRVEMTRFIRSAPHAGTVREFEVPNLLHRPSDYFLISAYFSASYFGTRQAMELDALRYAIDHTTIRASRVWMLTAWIAAAAALINAPGHTAQFLQPTTDEMYYRIRRSWARSAWETFLVRLDQLQSVGSREWRMANRITRADARAVIKLPACRRVALAYADPPYTKDQYSRYYHVYETMLEYDYPDSVGIGRYPSNRASSNFSVKSTVVAAFSTLFRALSERAVPLVLSYPDNGLLVQTGTSMAALLKGSFTRVTVKDIRIDHSTMGASRQQPTKPAVERIYVAYP